MHTAVHRKGSDREREREGTGARERVKRVGGAKKQKLFQLSGKSTAVPQLYRGFLPDGIDIFAVFDLAEFCRGGREGGVGPILDSGVFLSIYNTRTEARLY